VNNLADTFKALSDETRLEIMTLLLEREELCVCDFVETLGLTQSKVSRHLRYLYHAGLVEDRRDGLWTRRAICSGGWRVGLRSRPRRRCVRAGRLVALVRTKGEEGYEASFIS
jgi:DNA-binding transcriptional ArsR family regulator